LAVRLVVRGGPWEGVPRAEILRRAEGMLQVLQMRNHELSLVLTGDEEIRYLNRIYRHKDHATDVLAFAQREGVLGERAGALLGDVIVSIPTARRQAQKQGADVLDEVTMLTAHGLLHLLGWDHETKARDVAMQAAVAQLCVSAVVASWGERERTRREGGAESKRGARSRSVAILDAKVATKTRARRSKIIS